MINLKIATVTKKKVIRVIKFIRPLKIFANIMMKRNLV